MRLLPSTRKRLNESCPKQYFYSANIHQAISCLRLEKLFPLERSFLKVRKEAQKSLSLLELPGSMTEQRR